MGVHFKEKEEKVTLGIIIAGIAIIGILIASLIVYLINVNSVNNGEDLAAGKTEISKTNNDEENNFESVSIDIGKNVQEASNQINETANNVSNTNTTTVKEEKKENTNKQNTNKQNNTVVTENKKSENSLKTESKETDNKNAENKVTFKAPLKGEIIKEFASDSLVYSATLDEWITHNGVDIKADKTSVVKAASKGKVYAIKNDPRYGLTVIVNHDDGYQTVYANLLTAEYVVEGEEIQEGQTIGTVGNSANFEIGDDYHLHFEVIKDGGYLNPCNLMEF